MAPHEFTYPKVVATSVAPSPYAPADAKPVAAPAPTARS